MSLPFDAGQFFRVFARYNEAVWPAQIALVLAALAILALLALRRDWADRAICALLALLWAWMAIVYHFGFFAAINPAALLFGMVFLVGAAAFFWSGALRGWVRFSARAATSRAVGYLLIAYALLGYPLASFALGHRYPATPTFGLPCPTTIFTLGVLAFQRAPCRIEVLIVPLAWALIASHAAWLLGVYEDFGLLLAGVALLSIAPRTCFMMKGRT
jgi:uncharacterized protein DUF6064